jgi:hypothetical protein
MAILARITFVLAALAAILKTAPFVMTACSVLVQMRVSVVAVCQRVIHVPVRRVMRQPTCACLAALMRNVTMGFSALTTDV